MSEAGGPLTGWLPLHTGCPLLEAIWPPAETTPPPTPHHNPPTPPPEIWLTSNLNSPLPSRPTCSQVLGIRTSLGRLYSTSHRGGKPQSSHHGLWLLGQKQLRGGWVRGRGEELGSGRERSGHRVLSAKHCPWNFTHIILYFLRQPCLTQMSIPLYI
uniref:Uncharacterized protein n=1 Tax=Rousettus aegyptiacus TaxID=9407 RepID=A0A7J8CIF1_ROUAE|nr:hypothetical protein HJG63_009125 [Rousettus aegyptiacus]